MTIRPAQLQDAATIAHIHVTTWQATYRDIVPQPYLDALDESGFTARWTEWLRGDASTPIFVAATDQALVGFAAGGPIRKPISGYDAELYALYVLPNSQRTGVGRRLIQSIAQKLFTQGLSHILVWVLRDNPALTFYQHLGATVVTEDTVDIGGAHLPELALAWPIHALMPIESETYPA